MHPSGFSLLQNKLPCNRQHDPLFWLIHLLDLVVVVVAVFQGCFSASVLREINKSNKAHHLCELLFDLEEARNTQINNLTPYSLSSEDDAARNKEGRESDLGEG